MMEFLSGVFMRNKPLFIGSALVLIAVVTTSFLFIQLRSGSEESAPPESERLLFVASAAAGELIALRELLDNGINVNLALTSEDYQDGGLEAFQADARAGTTALIAAARNGQVETIKLLLAAGADPNLSMNDGRSPLHYAAVKCHIKVFVQLIEKGARIDGQSVRGSTPLHLASMRCPDVTRLLLEYGADPNVENVAGDTPLTLAVECFNAKNIKLLVDAGAIVDHKSSMDGGTALHLASTSISLSCVIALLEAGADIEAKTKDSEMTPLMLAVDNANLELVKFLVEAGAKIAATDALGRTALQIAEEHREATFQRKAWRSIANYLRKLP